MGGGGGLTDPENISCLGRGVGLTLEVAHEQARVQGGLVGLTGGGCVAWGRAGQKGLGTCGMVRVLFQNWVWGYIKVKVKVWIRVRVSTRESGFRIAIG